MIAQSPTTAQRLHLWRCAVIAITTRLIRMTTPIGRTWRSSIEIPAKPGIRASSTDPKSTQNTPAKLSHAWTPTSLSSRSRKSMAAISPAKGARNYTAPPGPLRISPEGNRKMRNSKSSSDTPAVQGANSMKAIFAATPSPLEPPTADGPLANHRT
jgi:hypothetical protein